MRYTNREGPPSCPPTMNEEQRQIWDETISSAGPDHWRAADAGAIEAFVVTRWRMQSILARLAIDGEIDAEGNRTQASRIAESTAKVLGQLAPKLRLCPSARTDSRQAGRTTSGGKAMDAYLRGLDDLREGRATDTPWKRGV